MNVVALLVRRPYFAIAVTLLSVVVAAMSFPRASVSLYPNVARPGPPRRHGCSPPGPRPPARPRLGSGSAPALPQLAPPAAPRRSLGSAPRLGQNALRRPARRRVSAVCHRPAQARPRPAPAAPLAVAARVDPRPRPQRPGAAGGSDPALGRWSLALSRPLRSG